MMRIPSGLVREATLACIVLAASLRALGQSSTPGEIQVYANEHDGETGTADFYVFSYTSETVSFSSSGWTLDKPFPPSIDPWGTVASTDVDLSRKRGLGHLQFAIGNSAIYIQNNSRDKSDVVYWQLFSDYSWTIQAGGAHPPDEPPKVDPKSGACTYTNFQSTAGFSASYSAALTKSFWYDNEKDKRKSKVVLVIGENTPGSSGQAYQNCWFFP